MPVAFGRGRHSTCGGSCVAFAICLTFEMGLPRAYSCSWTLPSRWTSTTNGEYPSLSYESLRNEANLRAVQTWFKVLSDTRHWELEPYFDVDGARAVGLEEVEYLAYAQTPGVVEITLPKHKYNPVWVNPISGERYPNFPKTLHEVREWNGEYFDVREIEQGLTSYSSRNFIFNGLPGVRLIYT